MGDGGIDTLAGTIPLLGQLQALYLNSNRFAGASGAVERLVAAVGKVPMLQTLWLHQNPLDPAAAATLEARLRGAVRGLRTAPVADAAVEIRPADDGGTEESKVII